MKNILNQLKAFFGKLIDSEKPTSSKRFIALWTVILLYSYAVFRHVNADNFIEFTYPTYGFILALVGVSTYENIMKYKNK